MSTDPQEQPFSLSEFNELVSNALGSGSSCTYRHHYGSKSTSALDLDLSLGRWSDGYRYVAPPKEEPISPRPQGFLRKAIHRASFALSRRKDGSNASSNGRSGFTLKSMSLPVSPLVTSSPTSPRFNFNIPRLRWPLGAPASPKSPSTSTLDGTPPQTPLTPTSPYPDPFSPPSPSFFTCSGSIEEISFMKMEADPFAKPEIQVLGRPIQTIKLREPKPRRERLTSTNALSFSKPNSDKSLPPLPQNEDLDVLAAELGLDELLEQWPLPPPTLPFANCLTRKESDSLLGEHYSVSIWSSAPQPLLSSDRGRPRTRGECPRKPMKYNRPSLPQGSPGPWISELESPDNFYTLPTREGSVTPTPVRKIEIEKQSKTPLRPSTPFALICSSTPPPSTTESSWSPMLSSSAFLSESEIDRIRWNYDSTGNTPLPSSFISFYSKSVDSFHRF